MTLKMSHKNDSYKWLNGLSNFTSYTTFASFIFTISFGFLNFFFEILHSYNLVTSFELDQKSDFGHKIAILIWKLQFLSLLANFIKQNILTIGQNDCVRSLENPLNYFKLESQVLLHIWVTFARSGAWLSGISFLRFSIWCPR